MTQKPLQDPGDGISASLMLARLGGGLGSRTNNGTQDMWTLTILDTVVKDLRYGLRQLRCNPGFTAVAVIALALGIGVNTAIFTVYKAVILRPVEARDPGRIVNIALVHSSGNANFLFSYPDYVAYRESLHSLEGLIAFKAEHLRFSVAGANQMQRAAGSGGGTGFLGLPPLPTANVEYCNVFAVSENYFQVLGIRLVAGRGFERMTAQDRIAFPPVLISENYWEGRFSRDPGVLGRTVRLNQLAVTIVGITPRDFSGTSLSPPNFWLPIDLEPLIHGDENWLDDRENQQFRLYGRLTPGATIGGAQAEANILAEHLRALHNRRSDAAKPATALVWPGSPLPLPLKMYRGLILTIILIMLATAMVLVIACANVASLQLARGRSRRVELHTRLSLGASRLRLVRQLLVESSVLGLAAGAIALPFTWALIRIGIAIAAQGLGPDAAPVFNMTPDLPIFSFVFGISLTAGILFGLAPAIESSRSVMFSNLRGGTSAARTRRLQDAFLAVQVCLSLVLLIAASVLIRSSKNTLRLETGYDNKQVAHLSFDFPEGAAYNLPRKVGFVKELRERIAMLPGVAAVTSAKAPDDASFRTAALPTDGATSTAGPRQLILHYKYIQGNYFQTLGIPLLAGRSFAESPSAPEHVVILSESAAKQLWPEDRPLGRAIRLGPVDERPHDTSELSAEGPPYVVIGIARDTRGVEFDGSDSRLVYLPLAEKDVASQPLLVRSWNNPSDVVREANQIVPSIDPDIAVTGETLDELLKFSAPFIGSRTAGAIASAVGFFGLILALLGIYGTVSYIVVLRTREVGIRMAIGAQAADVLHLILRESLRPVFAGLAVGLVLAVGASYALHVLLFGLHVIDATSFVGVSVFFLAVGLLAAYMPSRRATRVDPQVALRHE